MAAPDLRRPAGLGDPLATGVLAGYQVVVNVFSDSVHCQLFRVPGDGDSWRKLVHQARFKRTNDDDPAAVGSIATSWYVDQLDLTGGWIVG